MCVSPAQVAQAAQVQDCCEWTILLMVYDSECVQGDHGVDGEDDGDKSDHLHNSQQ